MTPLDDVPIPVRRFLDRLLQLKEESGRSYETLETITKLMGTRHARSTLHGMVTGKSQLTWKAVRALVLACHYRRSPVDLGPWFRAYRRMQAELALMRAPKRAETDVEDLVWERDRFLSGERLSGKPIHLDWARTGPRDTITVCFDGEPSLDRPLIAIGQPIVDHLIDNWSGRPVSAILATPEVVVCTRRSTDRALEKQLDRNNLYPGFSYAERYAAVNGLGTALANGSWAYVRGPEHLAEELQDDVCAACVVLDPFNDVAGIFNLTCRLKDANELLLENAKQTAWRISDALRADYRAA